MKLSTEASLLEIRYHNILSSFEFALLKSEELGGEKTNVAFLLSWIVGNKAYAHEVRENVWEIVSMVKNYALCYRWNIATDDIEELSCWQKIQIEH